MRALGELLDLLLLSERRCTYCGKSFKARDQGYLCGGCLSSIKPYEGFKDLLLTEEVEGADFFGLYEGPLRESLLLYKFKAVKPLGKVLGRKVASPLKAFAEEVSASVITFVPAHPLRKWKRGYDHNEEILRASGLPFIKLLKRVRYAPPLAGMGREERKKALKGAYRALWVPEGASVLVFDDVLTTGTTAREVAGVLREAGAGAVYFYFLALEGR